MLAENLRQKKIPRLDALRAISALIVVLFHFGVLALPAGLGVMTFFVISGFLITWLLLIETERTGTVALGHFYFRRTFRIFPAFYVFWAVTVVGMLVKHRSILWGQAVATLFYVGNYYQGLNHYPETGLSHAWSLGVEEQYYLLWPAVAMLLARRPRLLFQITCGAILLVWVYRGVLVFRGMPQEYIYTAFDTRIDHLLIGCAVAIALRFGYLSALWRIVCARAGYALLTLAGLTVSSAAELVWRSDYRDTIGFIVNPVLIAFLLVQLLSSRSSWLKWMDSAPMIFLGAISYSTYLYHELAGDLAGMLVGNLPRVWAMVAIVAACYLAASASYFLVEKPFLRARARIENRWIRHGIHVATPRD